MSRLARFLFANTAVMAGLAMAAPITYNWSGVVTHDYLDGPAVGQIVTGSITVDPATFTSSQVDGTTYNSGWAFYWPASSSNAPKQTTPSQAHGWATTGTNAMSVGGGNSADVGFTGLGRNFTADGVNTFDVYVTTYFVDPVEGVLASSATIEILVKDLRGLDTEIFNTPAGDLDLTQGVNWFAPGAKPIFRLFQWEKGFAVTHLEGRLTSVSDSQAIPEPGTLALSFAAFAFLGARRRRLSGHSR